MTSLRVPLIDSGRYHVIETSSECGRVGTYTIVLSLSLSVCVFYPRTHAAAAPVQRFFLFFVLYI
jgi:hypothetical protein